MHLPGADLNLERIAARPDDRRVQRLIHVGLRHRDVIFEAPRQRRPHRVHRAERGVTVLDRVDDDPDRGQIVDRREVAALADLGVDRVEVLGTPLDLGVDLQLFELVAQTRDRLLDVGLALAPRLGHALDDLAERGRIEIAQALVLDLPLDLPDPSRCAIGA